MGDPEPEDELQGVVRVRGRGQPPASQQVQGRMCAPHVLGQVSRTETNLHRDALHHSMMGSPQRSLVHRGEHGGCPGTEGWV